jgi:hypothetical protein
MKQYFEITYAERLESYLEIVKATMPGFFVRWIAFMLIGLIAGSMLILNGLNKGLFGEGYWYVLLGAINAISFSIMAYKNINLKRNYNSQISDKNEWKYEIEITDGILIVRTDKSESRYVRNDIEFIKEMKKYIQIKSIYGSSIVLPKTKIEDAFINKLKELISNKEMPNN